MNCRKEDRTCDAPLRHTVRVACCSGSRHCVVGSSVCASGPQCVSVAESMFTSMRRQHVSAHVSAGVLQCELQLQTNPAVNEAELHCNPVATHERISAVTSNIRLGGRRWSLMKQRIEALSSRALWDCSEAQDCGVGWKRRAD